MNRKTKLFFLGTAALMTSLVSAEELVQSGFMTDYSQLSKIEDGSADYRYVAEGAMDRVAKFNAVMIDQPEIFIAADSPYRGAKPKHLNALAEAFRAGVMQALSEDLYVVDQPGPDVMYFSLAISNLRLTKKKKSVLGYTPIGLVAGGVRGAATTDIAKKANLQDAMFEVEGFDSVSGERLVAVIDSLGAGKEDPASWEELEELALLYGRLLQCRMSNARLPEDARFNCLAPAEE